MIIILEIMNNLNDAFQQWAHTLECLVCALSDSCFQQKMKLEKLTDFSEFQRVFFLGVQIELDCKNTFNSTSNVKAN